MVRTGLAIVALGLLGLFGYFFVTASNRQSNAERAKEAMGQVGDTVRDQGVAGLVRARLATSLGIDGARFLHVYFDEGKVLIYGLLPPGVSEEELVAPVRVLPGVEQVEVRVVARPEYAHALAEPAAPDEGGG